MTRSLYQKVAKGLALILAAAFFLHSPHVVAVQPDEKLADPALEARARELSKEVRCLVCQNQTIDDSNAELARELRLLLRERIVAGDSDEEIKEFLVSRYGDFVLFRPPWRASTAILWVGPFVFLGLGLVIAALYLRGRKPSAKSKGAALLSPEEKTRLDALLEDYAAGPDDKRDGE